MSKERICTGIALTVKRIAIHTAGHYANTACPLITYQPKVNNEVKKLRKF